MINEQMDLQEEKNYIIIRHWDCFNCEFIKLDSACLLWESGLRGVSSDHSNTGLRYLPLVDTNPIFLSGVGVL